eukprot:326446_1
MSPTFILLALLTLTKYCNGQSISGSSILCSGTSQCSGYNITCDQGSDCSIECKSKFTGSGLNKQCLDATISCPDDYTCTVECGGYQSCSGVTINGNAATSLTVTTNTEDTQQLYSAKKK